PQWEESDWGSYSHCQSGVHVSRDKIAELLVRKPAALSDHLFNKALLAERPFSAPALRASPILAAAPLRSSPVPTRTGRAELCAALRAENMAFSGSSHCPRAPQHIP